jgi:diamine N-acetyltransferase
METAKKLLIPLSLEHLPHVMKWVNDPNVMQFFAGHQEPISDEQEQVYLWKILNSNTDFVFSIFDGDTYIGQCSLNNIYWPAKNARMFIVILPEFQKKGYGTRAIIELLTYAFENLQLHKIWLITRSDNRNAQGHYVKLGFDFEGILKDEYFVQYRYFDMVRMSIINPGLLPPGDIDDKPVKCKWLRPTADWMWECK